MAKLGEKIPGEVIDARRAFREIRSLKAKGDHEAAHGKEDDLRLWVIKKVIAESPNTVALAKITLRASLMSFPRHCG